MIGERSIEIRVKHFGLLENAAEVGHRLCMVGWNVHIVADVEHYTEVRGLPRDCVVAAVNQLANDHVGTTFEIRPL